MTNEKTCPTCGRSDFKSEKGMKLHHSKQHGESIAGESVECDVCGKTFRTQEPERRATCSKECMGKRTSQRQSGKSHWNYQGGKEKVTCEYCEKIYEVKPHRVKESSFCSTDCRDEYQREQIGEDNLLYKQVEKECKNCGKKFSVCPSDYERRTTCSKKCLSEILSSEYNPRWEPDSRSNYGPEWRKKSDKIRKNRESCELCGQQKNDTMPVHHIIPVRAFKDISDAHYEENLVLLCRSCHGKVEWWDIPKQAEKFNTDPTKVDI